VREPVAVSVVRTLAGNRRRYGGLLVHLGVVVVAVGLTASHNYSTHRDVDLARGQTVVVDGYDVTYLGTSTTSTPQKVTVAARLAVTHGSHDLGTFTPALSVFPGATEAIGTPSVGAGLTRDVYITLTSSPDQRGHVSIGVFINPLVSWLWLGGLMMVIGAVVTGIPRRRRRDVVRDVEPALVVPEREPTSAGAPT
jgi:cytochrome c-type biogenesis protein CcmF